MGPKQSSHKGSMEDALKFFEDEVKKWNDNIKNLKESWDTKDRSWVPEYLVQQMDETEKRWANIRTMIELKYKRDKYNDNPTKLPACCKETTRQVQAQLTQMTKHNDIYVNHLHLAETKINAQSRTIEKLQRELSSKHEIRTKDEVKPQVKPDTELLQRSSTNSEGKSAKVADNENSTHIPSKTDEQQTAGFQISEEKTPTALLKMNDQDARAKHLGKENKEIPEKNRQPYTEKNLRHSLQVDKQGKKPFTTFKLPKGEEDLNVHQNVFLKTMMDLESKFINEKADLESENGKLLERINTLDTRIQELEKDNNVLSERLSKNPGNKLVENNPAITDLSDPNRPTKLAEYFSELYDNEWTDAFEALKTAGYDEITAINTLRLTLENALQFCEKKAELLLIKASDAVNLLFKEYQQSILDMALIMGKHLRREQSSLDDIKLQHMWKPKTEKGSQTSRSRSENANETEIIKVEAENELKTLRKKMASAMVPIMQKAYIESCWSENCIDEIKPFILKCLYLGWMMKVQSPPMVFHKFDMEARFDKNLYKEYMASGQLVSFVVLPALLLHENGPIVCKGVAEGKKIQT